VARASRLIDASGKLVTPGLVEARRHSHPLLYRRSECGRRLHKYRSGWSPHSGCHRRQTARCHFRCRSRGAAFDYTVAEVAIPSGCPPNTCFYMGPTPPLALAR
jgi:hypothetical protein